MVEAFDLVLCRRYCFILICAPAMTRLEFKKTFLKPRQSKTSSYSPIKDTPLHLVLSQNGYPTGPRPSPSNPVLLFGFRVFHIQKRPIKSLIYANKILILFHLCFHLKNCPTFLNDSHLVSDHLATFVFMRNC